MKTFFKYIKQVFSKKRQAKLSFKVKNYNNDPYFTQKAKEAKEILDKYGFPEELSVK